MNDDRKNGESNSAERSDLSKLGFAIYEHISAILAAIALAAFIGHFINFDWRGAINQLFSAWDAVVRPTVKQILDITIVRPLARLFNWHINIPVLVRDYIAVGLVFLMSFVRRGRGAVNQTRSLLRGELSIVSAVVLLLSLTLSSLLFIALWPIFVVFFVVMVGPVGDFISISLQRRITDRFNRRYDLYTPMGGFPPIREQVRAADSWNGDEIMPHVFNREESLEKLRQSRSARLTDCLITLIPLIYLALAVVANQFLPQ